MARMAATGRTLADLASVMTKLPQVLINVRVADRRGRVRRAVGRWPPSPRPRRRSARRAGCCCVRPGTEPLVRVMVEASTVELAQSVASRVADVVRAAS